VELAQARLLLGGQVRLHLDHHLDGVGGGFDRRLATCLQRREGPPQPRVQPAGLGQLALQPGDVRPQRVQRIDAGIVEQRADLLEPETEVAQPHDAQKAPHVLRPVQAVAGVRAPGRREQPGRVVEAQRPRRDASESRELADAQAAVGHAVHGRA
jgi:hypothetical protein